MRKCQMGPDAITLSSSVTACDKGAWQVALVHFVDFSWRKVCPNAFVGNALLSCCSSDSQWQAGLQMLMLFQQLHIATEVSFNIAFSMFDRSGAWQAAVALIPFVSQLHSSPSVSQLNSVMSCLAKVQQWQQAAHLLQHLHSGSIEATTATYCQLVEACKNDAAAALQWFQEMLKVKLELDATACLAVLSISAKHTWEIGVFALQSLREKDDLIAHNVAVSTLGKHARWQLGAHCAERVSSQGLRANIITFSSLLSSVEPGRWHVALGILSALPCRSLRPNDFTRSAAIASLGPGRQWRSITALLLEMSKEALELNQAWPLLKLGCGNYVSRSVLARSVVALLCGDSSAKASGSVRCGCSGWDTTNVPPIASGVGRGVACGTKHRLVFSAFCFGSFHEEPSCP